MVSLVVHAILGIVTAWFTIVSNPKIFSRPAGPRFSSLEIVFWAIGLASLPLCWYFNIRYVYEFSANPFMGDGANWTQFIKMGYANPAAASASADYTIVNVLLLPLFTIIDGRRRGIRRPWLFFVSSLFTSCAFAFAFYFATVERQRRHQQSTVGVDSPV
jgi:hypothetical protein